jgi:hypothetical protein
MIIDGLQILSYAGFPIVDYQYTGLGSIFFVDFIMFQKFLGIHRMLSIEFSKKIKKRVKFNRPFANIKTERGRIGEFIPGLNKDLKHLLWLDYDYPLDESVMTDVILAASELPCASILLITVDLEMPKGTDQGKTLTPQERMQYYKRAAGRFFEPEWETSDFALSRMANINIRLLFNAIKNGLAGREEVTFLPLFSFIYADGHRMFTFGGMIANPSDKGRVEGCDFRKAFYMRRDVRDNPYEIMVPIVTRKERLHLDSHMPCEDAWKPKEFELDGAAVLTYREIYRFYPAYAELLL